MPSVQTHARRLFVCGGYESHFRRRFVIMDLTHYSKSLAAPLVASSARPKTELAPLKLLPRWQAVLVFGVLGAMVYVGIYVGVPVSLRITGSAFPGLAMTLTGACVLLFIVSIVALSLARN